MSSTAGARRCVSPHPRAGWPIPGAESRHMRAWHCRYRRGGSLRHARACRYPRTGTDPPAVGTVGAHRCSSPGLAEGCPMRAEVLHAHRRVSRYELTRPSIRDVGAVDTYRRAAAYAAPRPSIRTAEPVRMQRSACRYRSTGRCMPGAGRPWTNRRAAAYAAPGMPARADAPPQARGPDRACESPHRRIPLHGTGPAATAGGHRRRGGRCRWTGAAMRRSGA